MKTTIEKKLSGWYVAFVPGFGYLKADTLKGIRELIKEVSGK